MKQLAPADYMVIGIFLIGVVALGLAVSRPQKSLKDYFLASGNMPWFIVSISLYASLLTPGSFVGVTSWVFHKDSRWFIGNSIVGVLSSYLAVRVWIPLWHRLRPLSIYEYLEQRFGFSLRVFGVAVFLIQ